MEINAWSVVFVLLCVHANYSVAQYEFPSNPCPQLFQYQYYNGEWVGIADLPIISLEQLAKVEIVLAFRVKSVYIGSLKLFGSEEMAVKEIRSGQPVKFIIRFPLLSPLPKLLLIIVNERIVCSGAAEIWDFVTQLHLQHIPMPIRAVSNYQDNYNHYNQPESPPSSSIQYTPITQAYRTYITYNSSHPDLERCSSSRIFSQVHQSGNVFSHASETFFKGGTTVFPKQFPWLVAVLLNSEIVPTFICSGSLVSRKVIVTAASCFRQSQRTYVADDIVLDLGHYNLDRLDNDHKLVKAQELFIHNDYMTKDHTFDADLALVITKDAVQYTNYIQPICLGEGTAETFKRGTVYGYGYVSVNNNSVVEQQELDMPIVSQEECLRSNEIFREITSPRTFCAGKRDGSGPCYGNSGSGMKIYDDGRPRLLGFVITSLTNDRYFTCDLQSYVVFTDVTKFVYWIKSVISSF